MSTGTIEIIQAKATRNLAPPPVPIILLKWRPGDTYWERHHCCHRWLDGQRESDESAVQQAAAGLVATGWDVCILRPSMEDGEVVDGNAD
jgi:hypothetical protein